MVRRRPESVAPPLAGASGREPLGVLIELVERVAAQRGADTFFAADEVRGWPAEAVKALEQLGLLTGASPATSLVCPGCEEACHRPVHIMPGATAAARALIACDLRDDIGRVEVPVAALARFKSSGQKLAEAMASLLGLVAARPAGIDGHAWQVGQFAGQKHKAALVLSLDGVPLLALAGHTLALGDVLGWARGAVTVDQVALRKLVDRPTGRAGEVAPSAEERAQRIRARIAALKAQGHRDFRKRVADEEGLDPSRIGQLLREHPEPARAPATWFSQATVTSARPPAKKHKTKP